jgi:hypothetical protein
MKATARKKLMDYNRKSIDKLRRWSDLLWNRDSVPDPGSPKAAWEPLYQAGLLRKAQLVEFAFYMGHCRNAEVAQWDGSKFWYIRRKTGDTYAESICHPEDDNGFDLFLPLSRLVAENGETIPGKANNHA